MIDKTIQAIKIQKFHKGEFEIKDDFCSVEEPLQISVSVLDIPDPISRKNIAVTMRTPGDDKDLALGFLFTEGLLSHSTQVDLIKEKENNLNLILKNIDPNLIKNLDRNFYTSSSCGVCGKASIESVKTTCQIKVENLAFKIKAKKLLDLPLKLLVRQNSFNSTGGIHAAAIFNLNGELINVKEDVGRHNALDKLIGSFFRTDQLPLNQSILLLSGRASFELIQKASMAGINFVAAVGAPSSLAIELAKEFDITLVGFLKDNRFNIYCGEHRVDIDIQLKN